LNRGLAAFLGGDNCANIDRLARIPGSINPTSSRESRITHFSGIVHQPESLTFLTTLIAEDSPMNQEAEEDQTHERRITAQFPVPPLSSYYHTYIKRHPARGQGYDRSEVEHEIIVALRGAGWSSEQILALFDAYKLPRHREELMKNGDCRWTERSIRKADQWISRQPPRENTRHMCKRSCTSYRHVDNHELFPIFAHPIRWIDAIKAIQERGFSRSTAINKIKQYTAAGLLAKEASGRTTLIYPTEKGQLVLRSRYRLSILDALPRIRDLRQKEIVLPRPLPMGYADTSPKGARPSHSTTDRNHAGGSSTT